MNASMAHPSVQTPPKNTQEKAEDGLRGDWGELVVTNKPFSLFFFLVLTYVKTRGYIMKWNATLSHESGTLQFGLLSSSSRLTKVV